LPSFTTNPSKGQGVWLLLKLRNPQQRWYMERHAAEGRSCYFATSGFELR
jgi:hypothetical protein